MCRVIKKLTIFCMPMLIIMLYGCGGSGGGDSKEIAAIKDAIATQDKKIVFYSALAWGAIVVLSISAMIMPKFLEWLRKLIAKYFPLYIVKAFCIVVYLSVIIAIIAAAVIFCQYTHHIYNCAVFVAILFGSFFFFKDVYRTIGDSSDAAILRRKVAMGRIKVIILILIIFGILIQDETRKRENLENKLQELMRER